MEFTKKRKKRKEGKVFITPSFVLAKAELYWWQIDHGWSWFWSPLYRGRRTAARRTESWDMCGEGQLQAQGSEVYTPFHPYPVNLGSTVRSPTGEGSHKGSQNCSRKPSALWIKGKMSQLLLFFSSWTLEIWLRFSVWGGVCVWLRGWKLTGRIRKVVIRF